MTLTHFVFGRKKEGEEHFISFNHIYPVILAGREKAFIAYLNSPYFNKDKKLPDLFQRIKKANDVGQDHLRGMPILGSWQLDKKATNSRKTLCRAVERLTAYALNFSVHEKIQNDDLTHYRLLQSNLRNSGLNEPLKQVLKKMHQTVEKSPIGFEQLSDDFLLAYNDYYELETDREQQGSVLLNIVEQKLDLLYQTYKCKFANERSHLNKAARNDTTDTTPKAEVIHDNLLKLYQLNLAIHEVEGGFSLAAYHVFEAAFMAQLTALDATERYIFILYTINALNRGMRKEGNALRPLLFNWIKLRLKWKPDFIQQETVNDYLNTINVACCCGDLAYAKTYLETYRTFLPVEHADKAYFLGQADYLFRKQEYISIINLLKSQFPTHTDSHYFYMLRTKTLRIKACVEILLDKNCHLDDWDTAYTNYPMALSDLRIYLDRQQNKIPTQYQESHDRFRQIVNELMLNYDKIQSMSKKDRVKKGETLLAITQQKKALIARDWLSEKIQLSFF